MIVDLFKACLNGPVLFRFYSLLLILLVLAWVAWGMRISSGGPAKTPTQPRDIFKAKSMSVLLLKYPGPLLCTRSSKLGTVATPVSIAMYIEVSNVLDKICRVSDYSARALFRYDEGGEFSLALDDTTRKIISTYTPSGNVVERWLPLRSLNAVGRQLYWASNNDLSHCGLIDFHPDSFDILARDGQLLPGQSIKGWMLFEVPPELRGQTLMIKGFELSLSNSHGQTQSVNLDLPNSSGASSSGLSGGGFRITGKIVDLSKDVILSPEADLLKSLRQERQVQTKVQDSSADSP